MGFGIKEPTHVRFGLTFGEGADLATVRYVRQELEHDGWDVTSNAAERTLVATRERKTGSGFLGNVSVTQGPPDPIYMGKKAYDAYFTAVGGTDYKDNVLPQWHELAERQQHGWITAAMEILPWRE